MAHNITFALRPQQVARGVEARESKNIAADALRKIGSTPLMAPCERHTHCECAPQLSLKFVMASSAVNSREHAQPQQLSFNLNRAAPSPNPNPNLTQPQQLSFNLASRPSPLTPRFTFASMVQPSASIGAGITFALDGVARFAPTPIATIATRVRKTIAPRTEEVQCEFVDQYTVGDPQNPKRGCARFGELVYGVLWRNTPHDTVDAHGRKKIISSILGREGHYERFAAQSHVLGFVIFAAYAIVRTILPFANVVSGVLAVVAAWITAFVFLASTLYHCTSPDREFAAVTRVVDYTAIYIGLIAGGISDLAVATDGFDGVPVITIVDLPLAGLTLALFFLWRRLRMPINETWYTEHSNTPQSPSEFPAHALKPFQIP